MAIERDEKKRFLDEILQSGLKGLRDSGVNLEDNPDQRNIVHNPEEAEVSDPKTATIDAVGDGTQFGGEERSKSYVAQQAWTPGTIGYRRKNPHVELLDNGWVGLSPKDGTKVVERGQGEPGDYKLCQLTAFGPDGDVVPIANGDGTTVELSKLLNHNGDRASEVLPERIIFSNEQHGGQDVLAKEQQAFVNKEESNNITDDKADRDLAIITGQDTPRRDEDISPLQGGITPTTKKEPPFSEITDEVSLDELNPTAPQAQVLEVNSVIPDKNVERVVLEQVVTDPLVAEDDASEKLQERLRRVHQVETLSPTKPPVEANDAATPSTNATVDFVDPRITMDNPMESSVLNPQTISEPTAEPALVQSGLDNMPNNSAGQLPSAQFQENQKIIGGISQDIPAEAVEEPTPEQMLAPAFIDKPLAAEISREAVVDISTDPQPPVEQAQIEPIPEVTGGNIEDVEPASGALNDPNIFVDTNTNSIQNNSGFFASFADKFLHGNRKGREMRRVAGEKDASLDARIFADQGHHVETDDEILEKAA